MPSELALTSIEDAGAQEIHRGVRHIVFRVRVNESGFRVVKTVCPGHRAKDSAVRLRQEYDILKKLPLAGVARALALEERAELPALVLEDAGPLTLKQFLRRKPLEIDDFLKFAIQLAEIVGDIHRHNVIHRNINPANIVMSGEGRRLTLVDFDMATHVAGSLPAARAAGEAEGTLLYISPEQTGRVGRVVDCRSDLYSLGVTFHEMLTGAPPFTAGGPAELVHAHLARAPVPLADANPAVPKLLSDLVLKLLAKMPEQRYQSAEALAADLREVQRRWQDSRAVEEFELGRLDVASRLSSPGRLYGRERQQAELRSALARVQAGASELVIVVGAAGTGKTALVDELRIPAEAAGLFLSGKFDQLRGNVPFAPVAEAFRVFVRRLLAEPAALVDAWRDRIKQALGANASSITAVLPDLAQLIGTPAKTTVAPEEAERQFHLTFRAFVQALATAESPLVVFLDDLQWADSASLRLLQVLATADSRYVLFVGAFRPDEVAIDHPLAQALEAIRASGSSLRFLELASLDVPMLTAWCADTLRCEPARARPLAESVLKKTAGNPFFVQRFLQLLHQAGLLAFDTQRGAWEWDIEQVATVSITENVAELMIATVRRLPEESQRLLKVAACLPGRIELWLLAALLSEPMGETARRLWGALREGLLVPDWMPNGDLQRGEQAAEETVAPQAAYRFVHDRVQQAAYSLLPVEEQQRLHLLAGWMLLDGRATEQEIDERLYEAVDQLNRGAMCSLGPTERLRLADLNLRAGRKAKASSAFAPALAYLSRGLDLLPGEAWRSEHALWFELRREAAESAYLTGDFGRAGSLIDSTLCWASTRFEKADLYYLRIVASTVAQANLEAIRWGRKALRLFDMELPESDASAAALAELDRTQQLVGSRSHGDLLAAPAMRDPDLLACMRLLSNLTAPTWFSEQQALFSFVVTRMVQLSLTHGMAPESGGAFVRFGMILGEALGDYAAGHDLSRLGIELSRRHGDLRQECRALFAFAFHMSHWRSPLRSTIALYRRAASIGLECGELAYAMFAKEHPSVTMFTMGLELDQVLAEIESAISCARKMDHQKTVQALRMRRQAIRCLQGRTRDCTSFDDDDFATAPFVEAVRQTKPELICRYEILRLQICYLHGDVAGARAMSDQAAGHILSLRGTVVEPEHCFYTSLALAAACDGGVPEERRGLLASIAANRDRLACWAKSCPENFRHKQLLVTAEIARIEGRAVEAGELYDRAIDAARIEGFRQDEALAHELAGRFYLALGRKRIAAAYIQGAIRGFARWGATAKAEMLEEELRDLAAAAPVSDAISIAPSLQETPGLDVFSLLKAAETISGEVALDRLLEKLITVCLEAAGAQRGAIVLAEQGGLTVRAVGGVSEPVSLEPTPLQASKDVARTIVEHVFGQCDVLVLPDAARQGRFAADPYVAEHAVRSVLALPIRRQAGPTGVLYLENNLFTRAFPAERIRVLQLLSSQIGISLENSRLFENLKVEVDERKRAERAVRFLAEAGAAAAESLDYRTTLAKVARLAVPFLADWCTVDVMDREGTIQRVAAAHADPRKEHLLGELCEKYPPERDSRIPSAVVLRTGQSCLMPEHTDAIAAELGRDARHIELIRLLGSRSLMAVPLIAHERIVGALTFHAASPERRYGPADLALAQELARRCAAAVENSYLYGEAQKSIQLRDDFLSIASHELVTPLAPLKMYLQLLRRHLQSLSPALLPRIATFLSALEKIELNCDHLSRLIRDLLDVSRIRAGRLVMKLELVDLSDLVRDAVSRVEPQLARARCQMRLRVRDGVQGSWDRLRIEQVVVNLLDNAIKYGAGGPIEVTVTSDEERANIIIRDYGIGIPKEAQARIFERFERVAPLSQYGGLGLGLYIARQIVQAHRGAIRVESEPHAGSIFTVELPL